MFRKITFSSSLVSMVRNLILKKKSNQLRALVWSIGFRVASTRAGLVEIEEAYTAG